MNKESYQPSDEEIKKAEKMADAVQNERAEKMMTEQTKEQTKEQKEMNKYKECLTYEEALQQYTEPYIVIAIEPFNGYLLEVNNRNGQGLWNIRVPIEVWASHSNMGRKSYWGMSAEEISQYPRD